MFVFDWDGTLVDSVDRILTCFRRSFAALGLAEPEADAVKRLIGLPLRDAFFNLVGETGMEQGDHFAAVYRQFWLDGSLPLSALFPGVVSLLEAIASKSGVRMAVATGKSRVGLERELTAHDLNRYFVTTQCAGEATPKPQPGMLQEIMNRTDSAPGETLMIGDTWLDLEMARNAGVDSIAVLTGGHLQVELERYGPIACLASVAQMQAMIPA